MTKHPTGIPPLDDDLQGGLADHARVLVVHPARAHPEPFVYQAVHAHLARGGHALVQSAPGPGAAVLQEFNHLGFDVTPFRARLELPDDGPGFGNPLPGLVTRIQSTLRARPATCVSLPLDALVQRSGEVALEESLPGLLDDLRGAAFSFLSANEESLSARLAPALRTVDAVLRLGTSTQGTLQGDTFAVERCVWAPKTKVHRRAYTVARPGGVLLYLPKILVTGPHDAGKSEFIRVVSTESFSVETSGTTVALDHGRVRRPGVVADVFGTPGQERFTPIVRQLAQGALGVILLVDSTRPETFTRAREMLTKAWSPGLPLVVGANKHSQKGALAGEKVRDHLHLAADVPVVPFDAIRREPALRVLDALLERILKASDASAAEPSAPRNL